MNNNLGIMNNRFHKKVIQNRKRNISADANTIYDMQKGNKRNGNNEIRFANQKQSLQKLDSESNIQNLTPSTPKAQIPIKFEPKLIKDVLMKFYQDNYGS